MSLQTIFNCPAKLYTLKIFTHNRIREHPKGCSFSLVHITICIVTQITHIFESGEFTEFVQHGCGQKLFKVTRVTVTCPCAILPSLPSPTLWKAFVCVVFRVTVTVTGDGRGDANLCTVSRFVSALFALTSYPSCFPKTPHRASWRKWEHKCRVYLQFRRTTEQSVSNALDMLFALFVFCSFLFGNVRSVFVLEIVLKACKCAEYCVCSFCSAKKWDTPWPAIQVEKMWSEEF